MSGKQFNHSEALNQVWQAIGRLRGKSPYSKRLKIVEVSEMSGVARSTFYTNHPDWRRVREVISKGLLVPEIPQVSKTLRNAEKRTDSLYSRLESLENEVRLAKEKAELIFNHFLTDLQKYVALYHNTKERFARETELLKQNADLRHHLDRANRELANLRIKMSNMANPRDLN